MSGITPKGDGLATSEVIAADKPHVRHVCGLSGGKDSAALAIYMMEKGTVPNMEYFFTDTGEELPEVYDFVDRLEAYLGKPIARLSAEKNFDHHLMVHNNFLPSARQRWCTRTMKIKPFERFVGDDPVVSYVGIRADEYRYVDGEQSYRSGYKANSFSHIKAVFPFIEDGVVRKDVYEILDRTVGVPEYYKWRSRSGCYFCFFQQKNEWIGLSIHHPELFEKAKRYEKESNEIESGFTWVEGMSLQELVDGVPPEEYQRMLEEKARTKKKQDDKQASFANKIEGAIDDTPKWWSERLREEEDSDSDEIACDFCHR